MINGITIYHSLINPSFYFLLNIPIMKNYSNSFGATKNPTHIIKPVQFLEPLKASGIIVSANIVRIAPAAQAITPACQAKGM